MSIVNSKVILDDQDAARECFRLILDIDNRVSRCTNRSHANF